MIGVPFMQVEALRGHGSEVLFFGSTCCRKLSNMEGVMPA